MLAQFQLERIFIDEDCNALFEVEQNHKNRPPEFFFQKIYPQHQ